MPKFEGVIGQRYKIHLKKGLNFENIEGKDPTRFVLQGTYSGTRPAEGMAGHVLAEGMTQHVFTDVTYGNGSFAPERALYDMFFGNMVAVPITEGGVRRRRNTRKRNTRRASSRLIVLDALNFKQHSKSVFALLFECLMIFICHSFPFRGIYSRSE